jgi:diadenosine tetraphosphate (Ap4A) HIT family hydrolase
MRCERYTRNLSTEEWADFREVEIFMKSFYQEIKYYSFIREEGETKSVHHLHYHFLPGELPSDPFKSLLKEQGFEEILGEQK